MKTTGKKRTVLTVSEELAAELSEAGKRVKSAELKPVDQRTRLINGVAKLGRVATYFAQLQSSCGTLSFCAHIPEFVDRSDVFAIAYLTLCRNLNLDAPNLHISVRETGGADRLYIEGELVSDRLSVMVMS
ncbi:MAG: hypothetical protein OXI59_10935 [Gemmatimonadota bacterium]|nr:hypothetical protein [Gemmatimonadota bacterium]